MVSFIPSRKQVLQFTACLMALGLLSPPLYASDEHHKADHKSDHATKHHLGIFVGALDADESDAILGIEYEYKFNKHWGVGALYEDAKDAHRGDGVSSSIAALYFHPAGGWRLGIGVGREKVGGSHSHTETLYRVGVAYEFHVAGFGIEPSISFDTVDDEHATVYGVAFVLSF